jgi:hypothetical protein
MMTSPFIYGRTVSANSFTNREAEREKLCSNLCAGINTTIISPRRWGKSSLVEKVILEINKKEPKIKTVVLDVFNVRDEEEFLEMFARAVIQASSNKWEDWINNTKEFLKILVPRIGLSMDPQNDFSLSFEWKEISKHKEEILNLPERIAKAKNIRFVICLDEFQNLATFSKYEDMEKAMRANWQRHKLVGYCLYGSKRHMMTHIFNNSSKPFYRFGDIIMLQKIAASKWQKFIVDGFKKSGKKITKSQAIKISELMKCHSWYVQQLAHYTWQKTNDKVTDEILTSALNELLQANSPLYLRDLELLSGTQLHLLKAIMNGETQLTSADVMSNYAIGTPRNISKNKDQFINNDVIHKTELGYEFLDPAFELWLRQQFNNKSIFVKV